MTRCGFQHYAAIANELAGLHMSRKNDTYWEKHYLRQAAHLYSEWGATVKVDIMKETYPRIDFDRSRFLGSKIRGKSQYDVTLDSVGSKERGDHPDVLSLGTESILSKGSPWTK